MTTRAHGQGPTLHRYLATSLRLALPWVLGAACGAESRPVSSASPSTSAAPQVTIAPEPATRPNPPATSPPRPQDVATAERMPAAQSAPNMTPPSAPDATGVVTFDGGMDEAADSGFGTTSDDYTMAMCPGKTPNMLSAPGKPCDGAIRCGGAARCVGTDGPDADRVPNANRVPDCSGGKCVPDRVAIAGAVRFKPCDGTGGAGVCVPLCFALMRNPLASAFPLGEAGCGQQEICAPCINPLDQTDTGACDDTCAD